MTIQVILIDETQKTWVNSQNNSSEYKAVICDHGEGDDICASVMTLDGYEAWASYFGGAAITEIETEEL